MKFVKGTWLPDSDTYFADNLDDEGGFDRAKLEVALRFCHGNGIALDIGAHVGTWTRILAQRFELVYALEPCDETFACLEKNVAAYDNVHVSKHAVSSQVGYASILDDKLRPGNTGARYILFRAFDEAVSADHVSPVTTVDALVAMHRMTRLDFVKIDVEGHELQVLQGAANSFLEFKPTVLMEVKNLGRGVNPRDAVSYLTSLGAREVGRAANDRIFKW